MENYNSFINDLKTLISCKSVLGESCDGAPFGSGVKDALVCFLNIAKGMGFTVTNHNGYIGEVTFGNINAPIVDEVGIIGHLDVVPTGIGWQTPPFELTLKDGFYYGRGLVDDKIIIRARQLGVSSNAIRKHIKKYNKNIY